MSPAPHCTRALWPGPRLALRLPVAGWLLPPGGCDTEAAFGSEAPACRDGDRASGPGDTDVKPEAQGWAAAALGTQLWAKQKPAGPGTDPTPPQAPSLCLSTLPAAAASCAAPCHPASVSPPIRVTPIPVTPSVSPPSVSPSIRGTSSQGRPGQCRENTGSSRCFPIPGSSCEVSDPLWAGGCSSPPGGVRGPSPCRWPSAVGVVAVETKPVSL